MTYLRHYCIHPDTRSQTISSAHPPSDKQLAQVVARQQNKNPLRRLPDFLGNKICMLEINSISLLLLLLLSLLLLLLLRNACQFLEHSTINLFSFLSNCVSGVEELTQNEIKRDYRSIEMSCGFYDDNGEDEIDALAEKMIMRAVRPPAPPESNMLCKKRRYATWATDAQQMASDMRAYYNTVAYLQREVRESETEERRWFETYQFARERLKGSLEACKKENKELSSDSKLLQEMCRKEMGNSTTTSRKKKTSFVRDLIYELDYRKDTLSDLISEYEDLLEEISNKVKKKYKSF